MWMCGDTRGLVAGVVKGKRHLAVGARLPRRELHRGLPMSGTTRCQSRRRELHRRKEVISQEVEVEAVREVVEVGVVMARGLGRRIKRGSAKNSILIMRINIMHCVGMAGQPQIPLGPTAARGPRNLFISHRPLWVASPSRLCPISRPLYLLHTTQVARVAGLLIH